MTWVIGTDEAGYGPNLGPLVIGATVWRYEGELPLERALTELALALRTADEPAPLRGMCVADSKRLYSPGRGLARLESCLLAALAACDLTPGDWRAVWALLAPEAGALLDADPIYARFGAACPGACESAEVDALRAEFDGALARCGWRLAGVRCRAVFPGEFNAAVERLGNKANVLSQMTLELAGAMLAGLPAGDAVVCCDKHGGRNHYTGVLQHCFPESWVTPRSEQATCSVYECRMEERAVRFEFRAGGEALPPTALASMAAKYLRELAMGAFNAYWAAQVKDLRPTAGYPSDAKRFREDVRRAGRAGDCGGRVLEEEVSGGGEKKKRRKREKKLRCAALGCRNG